LKRPLPAAALVAAAAGAGWLSWWFLREEADEVAPAAAAAGHGRLDGAAAPAAVEPLAAAERREAESPRAAATPGPTATAPESYRRALSGIRGRLVEEDGTPAAGLAVELLELAMGRILGDWDSALGARPPQVPAPVCARGSSGEDGRFELHGALGTAFHALAIDVGGPRGTLRFVDRTLASGSVADLGDVVLSPFVTWRGRVVDSAGAPVERARVRATLFPAFLFQPGVADLARIAALMNVRTDADLPPLLFEIPPELREWEARLPFPTAFSGADGTFELAGVPQGLAALVVDREGFTGAWSGPAPTGRRDRDVGTIELSRGRALAGRVVDAAGAAVAGARVVGGAHLGAADLAIAFAATSGEDGSFSIDHLADGADSFVAAARREGDAGFTFSPIVDGSEPVVITLPAEIPLDVALERRGGGVVPDAELWVQPFLPSAAFALLPLRRVPPSSVTKVDDGRLRVSGLAAGRWRLVGRAPGFAPAMADVELDADARAATLQFAPALELLVHVTDGRDGAPVEHAEVSVATGGPDSPPLIERRTDALGVARLSGVPPAPLGLRVFHPAFAVDRRVVDLAALPADGARVDVALGPGATLRGFVHDGGRPLAVPMLFLLQAAIRASENPEDRVDIDDAPPRFAVAGADGTFTLSGLEPGERMWELIPRLFAGDPQQALPGVVGAARAGAPARRGQVTLAAGETCELEIDVDPEAAGRPAAIRGMVRVRDGSGSFRVRVHSSGAGETEERRRRVDVRAGERFAIEKIPPGFVNLSIERCEETDDPALDRHRTPLHHEWFELTAGEERVVEVFFDFASEEIVVAGPGGAAEGAMVTVEWKEEHGPGQVQWQSVRAVADESGIARLELPRPGRYRVVGFHPRLGRASVESELPAAAPITLRLDRGVACAGRLEITPDPGRDAPIWLDVVATHDERRYEQVAWAQLEAGSREFEFVGLAPGRYRAHLHVPEQSTTAAEFELGAAGDDRLVLRFKLR